MRTVRAIPQAATLIESMRDIGYSLETAIADIIDNSITAGAQNIQLFADPPSSDARIGILDDGIGMSEPDLLAAMRPGSRSPRDVRHSNDLGRFGLGLKTASFSQCRRLTVVSRHNRETSAAIWDLDHVAECDDWLVQIPDDLTGLPWYSELGESGTLVIWDKLDRVVNGNNQTQDFARRITETEDHLELIFHRFLASSRGKKRCRIVLNGRSLKALDPFHSDHPATQAGPVEIIRLGEHQVRVQAFTLPHHSKVTPAAWKRHELPGGYQRNQGFYVYREERLIVHGTWFGLARHAETTKLARVKIDIPNGLDADWKIDVKKASAQPPHQVRNRLRAITDAIAQPSVRAITSSGTRLASDSGLPVWNRKIDKGNISYEINVDHPMFSAFRDDLTPGLQRVFERLLEFAGAALPLNALYSDMAGNPEKVHGLAVADDTLEHALKASADSLRCAGIDEATIVNMLRVTEPFRSNWNQAEGLLQRILANEATLG